MITFLREIDFIGFSWVNNLPHPNWLVGLARFFTNLGTLGSIWLWLGLGLVIGGGKYGRRVFWLITAGLLAGVVFNGWIIKNLVMRQRPYNFFGSPEIFRFTFWDTAWQDTSFMSGHAMTAFTCAVIIGKKFPKTFGIFITIAFLISFSRVYLGAHWPLDAAFGAIAGIFVGYLILFLENKFLKRVK